MAVSLCEIWRFMREQEDQQDQGQEDSPLLDSGEESKGMNAIRSGMTIRKPECGDFWEDFISISGNADAMADLLEVQREKVTSWASKIRELIDKVKQADQEGEDAGKKTDIIPTGNDGPIVGDDTSLTDRRPLPS